MSPDLRQIHYAYVEKKLPRWPATTYFSGDHGVPLMCSRPGRARFAPPWFPLLPCPSPQHGPLAFPHSHVQDLFCTWEPHILAHGSVAPRQRNCPGSSATPQGLVMVMGLGPASVFDHHRLFLPPPHRNLVAAGLGHKQGGRQHALPPDSCLSSLNVFQQIILTTLCSRSAARSF